MTSISFRQDLGLKIASIVLSLLLWLYVQNQEYNKISYSFEVPVEVNPEPEELQLLTRDPKVSITVWGSSDAIYDFQKRRRNELLKAQVNGEGVQSGEGEYPIRLFPRSELVDVEVRELPAVKLRFEEKLSISRKVEVVPGGVPPTGFEFGAADVNPPEVEISGPKSLVLGATVQAKINLTEVESGRTYKAKVEVLDRTGTPISDDRIRRRPIDVEITPSLTPANPRRTLLISPTYTGSPAPGYHVTRVVLTPPSVKVQGDRAKILNMSVIETKPIALNGISARSQRFVELVAPPGIKVLGSTRIEVTVFVEPDPAPSPPQSPPPGP